MEDGVEEEWGGGVVVGWEGEVGDGVIEPLLLPFPSVCPTRDPGERTRGRATRTHSQQARYSPFHPFSLSMWGQVREECEENDAAAIVTVVVESRWNGGLVNSWTTVNRRSPIPLGLISPRMYTLISSSCVSSAL